MSSAVIQRQTEAGSYVFLYPEVVHEVQLAIYSAQKIEDREVVAIIDVLSVDGTSMSAETKGLHFSSSLQAMFRYIPSAEAQKLTQVATLKFPFPAARLSVQLMDWKTKEAIAPTESTRMISAYRSRLSKDSSMEHTCVLFAAVGEVVG